MNYNALKIKIILRHIGCWILVNLVIATFPIWVTLLSPFFKGSNFCSSILAYTFTFVIVSLYVYMAIIKKIHSPEMLTIWIAIPTVLIIWGIYIILNYNYSFSLHVELYLWYYVFGFLLTTGLLGAFLHKEYLKDQIKQELEYKKRETAEKTRNNVQNMKKDLS